MKLVDTIITDTEYAQLKNGMYSVYLQDIKENSDSKRKELINEIAEIGSSTLNEFASDTINFPFDKELFEFYKKNGHMKINDFVITASNLFNISVELVASKIREYVRYDFNKLYSDGLINKELVGELSELYIAEKKEKNKQSVDF